MDAIPSWTESPTVEGNAFSKINPAPAGLLPQPQSHYCEQMHLANPLTRPSAASGYSARLGQGYSLLLRASISSSLLAMACFAHQVLLSWIMANYSAD